jgi:hypothetical protein
MKIRIIEMMIPAAIVAVALAACGGGGDDAAGSLTALSIDPATITVTTPQGTASGVCSGGSAGTVFVYGGAAPYRLDNTQPNIVALDKSTVGDRGGSFNVSYVTFGTLPNGFPVGGCFGPVTVNIVDKNDRKVILTLNNKPGS